jgi:hypothetical protein
MAATGMDIPDADLPPCLQPEPNSGKQKSLPIKSVMRVS